MTSVTRIAAHGSPLRGPLAILLFLALVLAPDDAGRADTPAPALPRSSPEDQGVSPAALLAFIEAADRTIDAMHSFMLVRHGHVVAEGWWAPYAAGSRHTMYSLTKSFTSTAIGLAAAEGRLSLDDRVLKYFPADAPAEPGERLDAMRIRDLLRMATGHHEEPPVAASDRWARAFLAHPVAHKPGTFFLYNTPASHMLSAIIQKTTGMKTVDYLRPRLFEPLGIADPVWDENGEGETIGGYGLHLRTEDIARFGQLYLQKGRWQGRQLLPEGWVEAATSRQTSNGSNPDSDWDQGYGYQFWRSRHGSYRGDGAFGQFCLVLPGQDAVIAITSGVRSMQGVMDLVWEKLLPALQAGPLPADAGARERLQAALGRLRVRPQPGAATPSAPPPHLGRRFVFPANDQRVTSVALEPGPEHATLVVGVDGVEHRVLATHDAWRAGRLAYGSIREQPIAASGAWTAADTYAAKICFSETPFVLTVRLTFSGDQVEYHGEMNVGFGTTKRPTLVGRLEGPR